MKNLLVIVTVLFINSIYAQTIHNPDAKVRLTKEDIQKMGESSNTGKEQITLDFEGLGNSDEILNFYNAGTSGQGFSGIDFGIYFEGNTLSIIDEDAGGTGNFANEPSPSTVMFFLEGTAIMNVPNGFVDGFSFYYAASEPGVVYVYDGINKTGNIIATANFPATPLGTVGGDPTGEYDLWEPFGVAFEGMAKSIDFTGVQNRCGFDNITFGNVNPPLNIPPVAQGFPAAQPVELIVGDSYSLTVSFLSPEAEQTTDAVLTVPAGFTDFSYVVAPGNVCNVEMDVVATMDNVGLHQVQIVATDDGAPPESTTAFLQFNIVSIDPIITVNPLSLSESLNPDETSTQILTVSNTGDSDLVFDLEDLETSKRYNIKSVKRKGSGGDNPDDYIKYLNDQLENGFKSVREVSWLSETPLLGIIAPGESLEVEVSFDATGLAADIYTAQIFINSNDPVSPQLVVPVTLNIVALNCPYLISDDNENNAIQGVPDYDMDEYLFNDDAIAPIEFNIFIDEANVESAQLNLYAWDVDEIDGEVDEVYLNGSFLGALTGADEEWSTSVFSNIDPAFLNPGPNGKNLVQVFIDVNNEGWAVNVDWGQMIINDCMDEHAFIRYVSLDKILYQQGENVEITVEVDTDMPSQELIVETNLLNEDMVNVAGTSNTITIAGVEDEPLLVTLSIPMNATLGSTYQAQVIVYDAVTYIQQDLLLTPFTIWDGDFIHCMEPGWQIISCYVEPTDPQLDVLMADLNASGALIFMVNKAGIYWPAQNINTIGDWDSHSAYKGKIAESCCFMVDGEEVIDKTVSLDAGVAYLPVLSSQPVDASEIFNQIDGKLKFAFEIVDGLIYWPEGGIYTLEVLEPGKGYLLGMLEDGFVEFPEATKKVSEKKNTPQLIENAPYELNKTGNAHIISIQNSAMNDLNKGDIIAAFNANDLCVGMAQYKGGNQNLALVVYGDDFTTDNSDGMLADEVMSFGIYSPGTDDLTEVNPQWNLSMTHTNRFAENGLSMITGFKNTTGVSESLLGELSIYPNPNTGLFHVEGISCKVDIQVLNSTGQLIRQIEANSSVEINLSSYAKGIYYLKLVSEDEVRIEKIIME